MLFVSARCRKTGYDRCLHPGDKRHGRGQVSDERRLTGSPAAFRALLPFATRPRGTVTLFVIILTVIMLVAAPRPLSPDVSGQLWIADRLRHGARLYVDISEINPPLWFWLAIPVDAAADMLGVRAEDILILMVGLSALASLLATDLLIDRHSPAARLAILLFGACVLLIMPLRDLGQREQLTLIAALPYVALIAARRTGRKVSLWLVLLVAGGAAIGFAFKHYFVGVPLSLELWLLWCLRRDWRPVRPETLVLALGAASYIAAILLLTPEYLRISVPEMMLAYDATGGPSWRYTIRPAQPVWLLMLCGIMAQRAVTGRPLSATATALLVAALGFFIAWAIQHKGWPYQSIATTGILAMAMAATLASPTGRPRVRTSLLAVAALVAPILLFVLPTQWAQTPDTDIAPALADLAAGDTVGIISKEGRTAWPAAVNRDFRFPGRPSLWMLAAIDANAPGARNPLIDRLGRKVIRETVVSYRCLPPKRLVFMPRTSTTTSTTASASDNPLAYFRSDPQFARLLSHYRRLDRAGNFDAFDLVRPLDPLPASMCPRGI